MIFTPTRRILWILTIFITWCFPRPTLAVDFSGGVRYRSTFFKNFGLYEKRLSRLDSSDLTHDLRVDVRAGHDLNEYNRGVIQMRAGHRFGDNNAVQNARTLDSVRLHQAYLDMDHIFNGRYNLRLGRQELRFGREILVGANDWDVDGRSFDAIRFYTDNKLWDVDGFYSLVSDSEGTNHKIHFAGVNLKRTSPMRTVNEYYLLYLFVPRNITYIDNLSGMEFVTFNLGTRMEGKLNQKFFYHWMVNYQLGKLIMVGTPDTKLDIGAYSALFNLDYFVGRGPIRNVGVEYTIASGDKQSTARKFETFMALFPSDHRRSGAMDWWGMMNSQVYTAYLFYNLHRTIESVIEVHRFYIQSNGAAWYLGDMSPAWFSGTPQVNWPGDGKANKYGGMEVDFHWTWQSPWKRTFHVGYSYYKAGGLLKDAAFWNRATPVHWGYFQTEVKF
ncbi:alginate export family protein [bacterium]|nr:alginate export family protein [bacterium]